MIVLTRYALILSLTLLGSLGCVNQKAMIVKPHLIESDYQGELLKPSGQIKLLEYIEALEANQ